jgi:hypothetical protein
MLNVEVGAVMDSESRILLKTIRAFTRPTGQTYDGL